MGNELPSKGINKTIYRCNSKLSKLLKPYPHVQILETTTERAHYTKFGSHFNNMGKDWVAKKICEFIGTSVFTSNKPEIALPLQWTNEQCEDTPTETVENCTDRVNISSDKTKDTVTERNDCSEKHENTRRTTTRNKKNSRK